MSKRFWIENNEILDGGFFLSNKEEYVAVMNNLEDIAVKWQRKCADLEAKLAESEKAYAELKELEQATKESLYASREYLDQLKSEKWALEKQLAEKNELIKTQYDGIDYWKSLANKRPDIDFAIKNRELEHQLAEKEKENKKLNLMISTLPAHDKELEEIHSQDKISFAVEQLEKVKDTAECVLDNALKNCSLNESYYDRLLYEIDKQIEELEKEMK